LGLPFHHEGPNGWYVHLLGLTASGSGVRRKYENSQVRFLIAFLLIGQLTGSAMRTDLRRDAAEIMANADEGWVAMSDGQASWHSTPPVHLLGQGLVCFRVPDWQTILDTERASVLV
jgi:hypothetical protein